MDLSKLKLKGSYDHLNFVIFKKILFSPYVPSEVSPFSTAFIQAFIWVGLRLLFETSRTNFHKISKEMIAKLFVYVSIEVKEAW